MHKEVPRELLESMAAIQRHLTEDERPTSGNGDHAAEHTVVQPSWLTLQGGGPATTCERKGTWEHGCPATWRAQME